MQYKNLTIIGTSHIAQESLDEISSFIEDKMPNIIALELDSKRFSALMSDKKNKPSFRDIRKIGFNGYMFVLLGSWAEKKLGQEVGVMPGSEMRKAIELAKKYKLNIVLIDDDIENILRRLTKYLTWKEKINFLVDILKAVFKRERIEFDLRKVPEEKIIKVLLGKVKKRYPNIYRVLITERNKLMAKRLTALMEKNQDMSILVIVGAGHVDGIIKLINAHNHLTL